MINNAMLLTNYILLLLRDTVLVDNTLGNILWGLTTHPLGAPPGQLGDAADTWVASGKSEVRTERAVLGVDHPLAFILTLHGASRASPVDIVVLNSTVAGKGAIEDCRAFGCPVAVSRDDNARALSCGSLVEFDICRTG